MIMPPDGPLALSLPESVTLPMRSMGSSAMRDSKGLRLPGDTVTNRREALSEKRILEEGRWLSRGR